MNNFCDRAKGRIIKSCPLNQDLQGTAVALMRELRLEHIEAQLTRQGFVPFPRNKLEVSVQIDETTDKPRARHAVYVNTLTSNPGLAPKILPASRCNIGDLLARSLVVHTRFNSRDEPLCHHAASGTEKVNGDKLGKVPFKPAKVDLDLCTAGILDPPIRQGYLGKAASLLGNLAVFSVPGCLSSCQ